MSYRRITVVIVILIFLKKNETCKLTFHRFSLKKENCAVLSYWTVQYKCGHNLKVRKASTINAFPRGAPRGIL